ncbi:hypothetical protein [Streptomyces achromogenes]|uniref:hypothetical protein n=1 Tax=Streptomyces achromogenes TaxID=67255 RepID=UPI00343819AE
MITGRETANTAAADLKALCETVVRHNPTTAVAAFNTDQLPEPRSALVLACVLQLTDTDDGARFWWQYAAGAGQPAAYCLYPHHLALGETHAARWWHTQTNEAQPKPTTRTPRRRTPVPWDDDMVPAVLRDGDGASTTTLLHILRRLASHVSRPRSAVVAEPMTYMPIAVAVGYLREPDSELPLAAPDSARQIRTRLAAAAEQPDRPTDLPARRQARRARRAEADPAERLSHRQSTKPQLAETDTLPGVLKFPGGVPAALTSLERSGLGPAVHRLRRVRGGAGRCRPRPGRRTSGSPHRPAAVRWLAADRPAVSGPDVNGTNTGERPACAVRRASCAVNWSGPSAILPRASMHRSPHPRVNQANCRLLAN